MTDHELAREAAELLVIGFTLVAIFAWVIW